MSEAQVSNESIQSARDGSYTVLTGTAAPGFGCRRGSESMEFLRLEAALRYARHAILEALPNDLTRLIYLASLRDCNTGVYLHPELSRQNGLGTADQALRICHEEVFARLMATPLADYVSQLEAYIRYTNAEKTCVLGTWRSLPAYRATVPLGASSLETEFFFGSVDVALLVLDTRPLQEFRRLQRAYPVGR